MKATKSQSRFNAACYASAVLLATVAVACAAACSTPPPVSYPPVPPLWQDPDRHPFGPKPPAYESPPIWDGADHMVLRPASNALAVDVPAEAVNVNALDEVANSSWFTNRIGRHPFSPEDLATGPCTTPPLDPTKPWKITSGKLEGGTPGFVVEGPDQRRYLLKFDGVVQAPRPTTADVIGSRVFYAAGFTAPCNRIVFFDRSLLLIAPGAQVKTWTGDKEPFEPDFLDLMLSYATRLEDGRYRAVSSLYLEGEPLGPFTYEGTRDDDPNDVIDHENRRELRGAGLLSAWLGHSDAPEANTLTVWIPTSKDQGFIRHTYIDFGDCFGEVWDPVSIGRRLGREYIFDFGAIGRRFLSLGVVQESWETRRFGKTGAVLGYYDVEHFDPEQWVTYFPNTAFSRMTDRDGAWMARIIAHFTDAHLRRVLRTALLSDPSLEAQLLTVLRGRRNKILQRYLLPRSSLAEPVVRVRGAERDLCVRDLAVLGGLRAADSVGYAARYSRTDVTRHGRGLRMLPAEADRICAELPRTPSVRGAPAYFQVELATSAATDGRIVVHLYQRERDALVVGLERLQRR